MGAGGVRGAVMVCGTTSDAGKSFLVAGLCRLLARQGVRVAPFKAQNMANNASVTADGAEIGHAQWLQAVAAGVDPVSAMNPILLKPTSERTSQVVVRGRPLGEMSADAYHRLKPELRPLVLEALGELRARFDVVICEGAGSPAEINLLDRDIVNLSLAEDADMPAIVIGDIDRGGVFAALYGTVALLPDGLRSRVKGFVVNKLRGDPALLGSAGADLEQRCGVPTLGVIPYMPGPDLDGEDSLTLDNQTSNDSGLERPQLPPPEDVLDVAAIRWPLVANAGDLDPLRIEPHVRVRWVGSPAELGRPDLVVLPGSKATRSDLNWFQRTGLATAVQASGAPVVGICAGLQMCGLSIDDPGGVEGPPGTAPGLGWLPVTTTFEGNKVLDRPTGTVVDGPGQGERVAGYRIHHGRVRPAPPDGQQTATASPADADQLVLGHGSPVDASPRQEQRSQGAGIGQDDQSPAASAIWLVTDDGTPLGWHSTPPASPAPPGSAPSPPGAAARPDPPSQPGMADRPSSAPRSVSTPGQATQSDQTGMPDSPHRDQGTPGRAAGSGGSGRHVFGTTLHAVFEDDGFRSAFLAWVAQQVGKTWRPSGVGFEAVRQDRLDRIAATLEAHLDLDRLGEIITLGGRGGGTVSQGAGAEPFTPGWANPRSAGTENPTSTHMAGEEQTESIAP